MESQLRLLDFVFGRADALNGYWNLYIAVSLGLLGIMASAKAFTEIRTIKILLTVAFVGFALSNLDVIDSTNEQRRQLASLGLSHCPRYPPCTLRLACPVAQGGPLVGWGLTPPWSGPPNSFAGTLPASPLGGRS